MLLNHRFYFLLTDVLYKQPYILYIRKRWSKIYSFPWILTALATHYATLVRVKNRREIVSKFKLYKTVLNIKKFNLCYSIISPIVYTILNKIIN